MKLSKIAGAMSFAHLLGLASAKAEDDQDKKDDEKAKRADEEDGDAQREDESDEDYAKRMDAKEKDDEDEKAEGDDPEKKDDEEGDDDEKDVKKSKRAQDDEKVRKAERARCAEILAHGIAQGCVRQAGVFAFDADMTPSQAIKALQACAQDGTRPNGLRERMTSVRIPNVGADGGAAALDPTDPKSKALAIVEAGKKRRGEI